jgi:hypothetical protein
LISWAVAPRTGLSRTACPKTVLWYSRFLLQICYGRSVTMCAGAKFGEGRGRRGRRRFPVEAAGANQPTNTRALLRVRVGGRNFNSARNACRSALPLAPIHPREAFDFGFLQSPPATHKPHCSTRNSQSSRNTSKSLKTHDRIGVYPERPGARKMQLFVRSESKLERILAPAKSYVDAVNGSEDCVGARGDGAI